MTFPAAPSRPSIYRKHHPLEPAMFMTERHQHARAGRYAYLADVDPKRDRLDDLHVADEPALVELQVFAFDAKRAPDKAVGAIDPDKISSG